ncbi:ribosomal RNA methyltransferase [Trypanosoma brucei equiperdum]|uniref:rRNA methyltransferase 2, mitochondrial n=1 Tax=Trypanosoma brucei equiperdum TaxID=630700 RepID=A0A3L6L302_9TRYP|nr:ribosomal RNA methyltransferase [Trypanosoma brucei equiperdum]
MHFPSIVFRRHGGRQWMQQQSRDPFVLEARRRGYVARSAFKLLEMDDKFTLFSRGNTRVVVDIGCSPGSWLQVIRERCGDKCAVFGVDVLRVASTVTGAVCIQGDFTNPAVREELLARMLTVRAVGVVDVVTSDMCLNRGTGSTSDRQKQEELNRSALAFALEQLVPGGNFVCKVLGSPTAYEDLRRDTCRWFVRTDICKPSSSRLTSDEAFMVCRGKREIPRDRSGGCDGTHGSRFGLDDWPGQLRGSPRRRKP